MAGYFSGILTRRRCFHHDHVTVESWIASRVFNLGWRCTLCGRRWLAHRDNNWGI